jgi:hypothetical protein
MHPSRVPSLARTSALLGLALVLLGRPGAAEPVHPGAHARSAAGVPGQLPQDPLPPPWVDADIGAPALPGSATYSNGTFTVQASGADIESNLDQFHYVYQPVTGDVTIIARLASLQPTDPWAKAGVMIRETLDPDSKHAMMFDTPGNGLNFARRTTTGGGTDTTNGPYGPAPHWVALIRVGDVLTGYASPDGLSWTLVGSDTIPMAASVFAGLPLTSHNNAVLGTATFDNVSVAAGSCLPGNVLVDGGFEETDPGTLVNPNWAATSTQFGTPICGHNIPCGARTGTALPRQGTFWGWFGGGAGVLAETASLSQDVTLPSGASSAILAFNLWVSGVSDPFTDTLEIQVDGVTQATITEPTAAEGGYTLRTVDLTAFADGASHTIKFLYTQPANGGNASFNVDDATLIVTCPGEPTLIAPVSLTVDPVVNDNSNGNGVLEMNENAILDPAWSNNGATNFTLTGTASNFTGPGTGVFGIPDPSADYGLIPALSFKDCLSGTPNCYVISINGVRADQPIHFDATIDEAVVPAGDGLALATVFKTWTIHVGGSFADVDPNVAVDPYYPKIETILHNGITGGCAAGPPALFCPSNNVLRQEMAPFLLKASNGGSYVPPDCVGLFQDVPCPPTPEFPFSNFIENLATAGITGGCQVGPPALFCPGDPVTRAQMAPFLLKTRFGGGYTPPDCTGHFTDVPCPATPEFPYSNFIEDLSNRGITAGCQVGPPALYCPDQAVTREQMAAFLTLNFSLVLYGP